jgi:hypothetical protein
MSVGFRRRSRSRGSTAPRVGRRSACCPTSFASRLPGTLDEVEQAAIAVEAASSLAGAAEQLRPADAEEAVTSVSAERWTARRVALAAAVLRAVVGIFAERFAGITTMTDLRRHLGTSQALVVLREIAAAHLGALPPPLGFGPRPRRRRRRGAAFQHDQGPDPPQRAR